MYCAAFAPFHPNAWCRGTCFMFVFDMGSALEEVQLVAKNQICGLSRGWFCCAEVANQLQSQCCRCLFCIHLGTYYFFYFFSGCSIHSSIPSSPKLHTHPPLLYYLLSTLKQKNKNVCMCRKANIRQQQIIITGCKLTCAAGLSCETRPDDCATPIT